jgi:hypothetical protein
MLNQSDAAQCGPSELETQLVAILVYVDFRAVVL